jgi:capsular exopolysaccharide synthesis family protein
MMSKHMIKVNEPKSCMAEVYRVLRNNIEFAYNNSNVKSILVTSTSNGEGKTTVAANLAVTMANSGKKVLLIDCNLNSPSLHKVFKIDNNVGLSTILNNEKYNGEVIAKTSYENLYVLTSGINSERFSELLMSKRISDFFKIAKEEYDFVIVDTPAVMERSDAQIISQYVEGCLLVIGSGQVNKEEAKKTKELLEKVNAKILGAVLNKTEGRKKIDPNIREYENVIVTEVDKVQEFHQNYNLSKLRRQRNSRKKGIFARIFTFVII